MIAKDKAPALALTLALLGGCAPEVQRVYYYYPQPVYQAPPQAYYPTPYTARTLPRQLLPAPQPQLETAQPAPEKTETARLHRTLPVIASAGGGFVISFRRSEQWPRMCRRGCSGSNGWRRTGRNRPACGLTLPQFLKA